MLAAVVRPYPERVAGQPLEFSFEELSGVFTFRYAPDSKITAPTLISVPTKFRAWTAACDGCEVEKEERQLRVTKTSAAEVTLTLRR